MSYDKNEIVSTTDLLILDLGPGCMLGLQPGHMLVHLQQHKIVCIIAFYKLSMLP